MSKMRCETISFCFLISFSVWELTNAGAFAGCFFINNSTKSVSFYCKESTGSYPKVNCLSLFFGNNSWEVNRSALKFLKLSECKGTDLNRQLYKTFTNLREFDVSFYGVQNLNSETLNLMHLQKFNASHNKLTNIGGSIFYNSPDIMNVDFSYNKITKIFSSDFLRATKLSTINFSHNEIFILGPETFRNLSELNTLDLSYNLIATIDKTQFNGNLTILNLQNNPIIRIDCNILQFLMSSTKVEFTWAYIRDIDKSCSKNVVDIELNSENDVIFRIFRNNSASELVCSKENVNNLRNLNISGNQLQNTAQIIDLLGSSIEKLDISSNFVGKLDTETLKKLNNLMYLNLSHTNLSNFGFNTFYNQRKLQILDLSYNHMKKIDFTLFVRNFKTLHTLNIEGNDLIEVNTITRSRFPKLNSLGLSKNHFSCHYLANFLLQWENLTLFENPSDQTHIDGVDCYHKDLSSKRNTTYEIAMDLESSADDDKSYNFENVSVFTTKLTTGTKIIHEDKSVFENTSQKFGIGKVETIEHLSHTTTVVENNSTDFRIVERILLVLCIVCFGILVVKKTSIIQNIRQKLERHSLDRNIGYQREERGSRDLSFIYSGVTTL